MLTLSTSSPTLWLEVDTVNIQWPSALPLTVLCALAGATACSTARSSTALPDGVTVHTFRRDYTNAHVVARGTAFFMVDAGLETNAPALANDLRKAGFAPEHLRAIVLTHGHADHAGGARFFQDHFGTPVLVGAADAPLLAAGANDRLCPTNDDARKRWTADQAARFTPFRPNGLIGSHLSLAPLTGIDATVVALPGHTAGSLVVVLANAALVGDLFRGAILGSTAETHFYMCDLDDNQRDVRALLTEVAPRAATFFTGHFGPVARPAVAERFLQRH